MRGDGHDHASRQVDCSCQPDGAVHPESADDSGRGERPQEPADGKDRRDDGVAILADIQAVWEGRMASRTVCACEGWLREV